MTGEVEELEGRGAKGKRGIKKRQEVVRVAVRKYKTEVVSTRGEAEERERERESRRVEEQKMSR